MITDQIATEQPLPPPTEPMEPDLEAVRSRLISLEQRARAIVRKQPVVAVLAAASLGYLVARLVSRGRR